MCMFFCVLKDYPVSWPRASKFRNPELVKSYIRRVLAMGYGTYNFVKYFKGSGVPRACILNTKIRKKRREEKVVPINSKKGEVRKKYFLF